jgi:hypothetical protein
MQNLLIQEALKNKSNLQLQKVKLRQLHQIYKMLNQKDFYKTTKNSLALSQELQKPLK